MLTLKSYYHYFRPGFIVPYYFLTIPGFVFALIFLLDFFEGRMEFWLFFVIVLCIGPIAILLPIFFGFGARTLEFFEDKIKLSEKPIVFFSHIRKKSIEYSWADMMGWRTESVMHSMHHSVEGVRLYFNDGGNYLVSGKWLYKDGVEVQDKEFMEALMPKLSKIKTNREYMNRRNPVNYQYYGYLFLQGIIAVGMVVVVAGWMLTGKFPLQLTLMLATATVVLTFVGGHIKKN